MIEHYVTEEDLKGRVANLDKLHWNDDEDFSRQKSEALQELFKDLKQRGLNLNYLSSGLILRNSGTALTTGTHYTTSVPDSISRGRLVYNVTVRTGTSSITLQGSYDNTSWNDIETKSITATGVFSFLTEANYSYYRLKIVVAASSTLDLKSYLIETIFDLLLKYKWLEIINKGLRSIEGDEWDMMAKDFRNDYNKTLDSSNFNIYLDTDAIPDASRQPLQLVLTR